MGWELPSRNDDTECGKPHGQSRCIRPKGHDGGHEHNDLVLAARREGVIAGLEWAIEHCHYDPVTTIRAEIERYRRERL